MTNQPVSPTNRPWDSPAFANMPNVQKVLRSRLLKKYPAEVIDAALRAGAK